MVFFGNDFNLDYRTNCKRNHLKRSLMYVLPVKLQIGSSVILYNLDYLALQTTINISKKNLITFFSQSSFEFPSVQQVDAVKQKQKLMNCLFNANDNHWFALIWIGISVFFVWTIYLRMLS